MVIRPGERGRVGKPCDNQFLGPRARAGDAGCRLRFTEVSSWSKLKTIHDSGADPVDFLREMATVMGDVYVQK